MKKHHKIRAALVGFLILSNTVYGQTYYYDGDRKVEIQEDPQLMAEIAGPFEEVEPESTSIIKKVEPTSSVVESKGGVRFWKANPFFFQRKAQQWEQRNKTKIPKLETKYLPVYRNASSTKLVPTGNIIVYFSTGMSEKDVKAWAASKGLKTLEKLPLKTKNAWVLETPPGKKSIQLANQIHESGEVVSATPNFWIEFSKK